MKVYFSYTKTSGVIPITTQSYKTYKPSSKQTAKEIFFEVKKEHAKD